MSGVPETTMRTARTTRWLRRWFVRGAFALLKSRPPTPIDLHDESHWCVPLQGSLSALEIHRTPQQDKFFSDIDSTAQHGRYLSENGPVHETRSVESNLPLACVANWREPIRRK